MSDLEARMAAREAVVRERKATAEAATAGPWAVGHARIWQHEVAPGALEIAAMLGSRPWACDATHIAANDPRTVIAECVRELAGIAADRELLAQLPREGAHTVTGPLTSLRGAVRETLTARYGGSDDDN